MLDPIFTGFRRSSALSEFAERFKYIVISSALLSPSLSTSSISRVATPTTPGDYPIQTPRSPAVSPPVSSAGSHIPTYTLAFLVPLALMGGYYLSCILLLITLKVLSDGGLDFPSSIGLSNGEGSWTSVLHYIYKYEKAPTLTVCSTQDFRLFRGTYYSKQRMG